MELSYILEKETPQKKFLTFSQKKAFLIKTENGHPEKSLHISGNGIVLYFITVSKLKK